MQTTPMQNTTRGKMAKTDVMLLMLIFFAIGLSSARSIGKRQVCPPVLKTDGCSSYECDNIYYYFDKGTPACNECKWCPKGEEPDTHFEVQRKVEDVKCEPCKDGEFSDSMSQEPCFPCNQCDALEKETVAECTPTSDAICGGCKLGYYLNGEYCDKCGDHLESAVKKQKGCPLTTPRTPTTNKITTPILHNTPTLSHMPSTPKKTTSSLEKATTLPLGQVTTLAPKQTTVKNLRRTTETGVGKHEVGHLAIANLGIILLGAIFMLAIVIFGMYCSIKICVKLRMKSNDSGKHGSKQSSEINSSLSTRNTSFSDTRRSSDTLPEISSKHNKQDESYIGCNLNVVNKKLPEKDCTLPMERIDLETQKNPNDDNQPGMTCSTPPGIPYNPPVASQFNQENNLDFNNLNKDIAVCSVPEASVKVENDVRSSGEESDPGLGERVSLLNGGTPAIKPKRRLSNSRYFSLSSAGGVFSSGSGTDTPDSIVSRSINDTSSGSCTQLLSSDPSRATKGKRNKLKKQNSYDNGVMEKLDVDNEVTNTSPLLECNESPNGPVMQESSDDRKQAEAVYLSNQQLNHLQSASNQGSGSEDHTPQDSIAKCNIEANQTDRIDNSPPQSPISANLSAPPPLQHPGRSPNRVPVGHGRYIPRTPSPKRPSRLYPSVSSASSYQDSLSTEVPVDIGHTRRCPTTSATPIIVNKYYAPVTQYQASNSGQIAVGNNCNQIQQQGPGGVDSLTQPRTPEGSFPCSDDCRATYPSDGNPLT